jgi:hypothetical protein
MIEPKTKTGLMYSELSSSVYWGTMSASTGIARSGKKDITSDFIGIMLKKFPVNTMQNITCNGEAEVVIMVLDSVKAERYKAANEMYKMLEEVNNWFIKESVFDGDGHNDIEILLAKARGAK